METILLTIVAVEIAALFVCAIVLICELGENILYGFGAIELFFRTYGKIQRQTKLACWKRLINQEKEVKDETKSAKSD